MQLKLSAHTNSQTPANPNSFKCHPHTIHLSGTLLPLVHLQRSEQNIITDPTAMSLSTTLSRQ